MRWNDEIRREALNLFEQGYGKGSVSSRIGVSKSVVARWLYTYRALGREALFVTTHKHYAYELKLAAARDKVEHSFSTAEIMERYGVRSPVQVNTWAKLYQEGGEEALRPKKKGRRSKVTIAANASEKERLKARILELELELEIQKRINALVDEQELK